MYEEHDGLPVTPFSVTLELPDATISEEDLLLSILQEFGVVSRAAVGGGRLAGVSRQELIDTLHAYLRSLHAIGAHAQVIIRGSERLSPDVLQQIALLSNAEAGTAKLLQIVLVRTEVQETAPAAPPPPQSGRTRPSMARVAAGLLLAAVLGGSAAAVWHYREYATAFVQRVASHQ